jgi:tape measure domain-containing protein
MLTTTPSRPSSPKQLVDFANKSPFQLGEVSRATQTLLGFGVAQKQVIPTIKQLGDVAGATGGDFQALSLVAGQIFAQGTVHAQDFYQLINARAGALGPLMAKALGVDGVGGLRKAFDEGQVSSSAFFDALTAATAKGGFAFQGSAKLADTFAGRMSTLTDTINATGRAILGVTDSGEVIKNGLFDKITNSAKSLTDFLSAHQGDIANFAKAGIDVLSVAFGVLALVIGTARDLIVSIAIGLSGLKPFIDPIVVAFQQIWAVLVQALQPAFDNLIAAFNTLGAALVPYIPLLEKLGRILGVIIVADIIATVVVIAVLVAALANIIAVAARIVAVVSAAFLGVEKVIIDVVGTISRVLGVNTLFKAGADLVIGLVNGISSNAGAVVNKIKEVCGAALNAVKAFFGIHSPSTVMAQIGGFLMEGLAGGIDRGSDLATGAVTRVSAGLQDAVGGLRGGIAVTGALAGLQGARGGITQTNTYHVYNQVDMVQANKDANWGLVNA